MTLSELVAAAFAEDLPHGDVTTDNLGLSERIGTARLIAKEDLVLSGREVFAQCVHHVTEGMELNWKFHNGDFVLNQQVVCWLRGDLVQLLRAERVALNFLGRLSGVATLTRCFAQQMKGTNCQILDTRKTTPLLRGLEKQAVRDGGGQNHRMNLSDGVLIKENHICATGGVERAIRSVRAQFKGPIEVECRTLDEVKVAVRERVQRILLDNMDLPMMREAREMIPRQLECEASGNMTLERVRAVAELGIDFISVGALTHSAPCADFSLMFDWQ